MLGSIRRWSAARWEEGAPRRLLVRELVRRVPGPAAAVTLLAVVIAVIPNAFLFATGAVVRSAAGGRDLTAPVLAAGLLFVAQQVLVPALAQASDRLGARLERALALHVADLVQSPAGLDHLEDPGVRDLVAQAQTSGFSGLGPHQACAGLIGVFNRRLAMFGAFLIVSSWSFPVAVVVAAGGMACTLRLRSDLLVDVRTQMGEAQGRRRANAILDLALLPAAAKEIRVFGLAGWLVERFTGEWLGAMRQVWADRRRGWPLALGAIAANSVALGLGYALVARSGAAGHLDAGRIAMLLAAVSQAGGVALGGDDINLAWGAASLPAVVALEAAVAERIADEATGTQAPPPGSPTSSIRFEGVAFRYPGRDDDVYADLDLEIRAGESLAVVGVNGAGKTTLVKLLAGLRRPTAGRITVDGVDLADLDRRAWLRRVAAIFQDFVRYQLPAADNVGFGWVEGAGDAEANRRAAERAGAIELIDGLEHGWDTVLSRRHDDGTDLSGGQWQRIALARALLAVEGGAGLLVLDEPTANLDVRAEVELFDRFLELTAGVTTILISHRFSTVRRADRICVLDGGRVAELGTHDELLAAGGRYAELFLLQAARFRDGVPEEDEDVGEVVDA